MAKVINILWPCQLTAIVMTCVDTKRTRFGLILMPQPHLYCTFYLKLKRNITMTAIADDNLQNCWRSFARSKNQKMWIGKVEWKIQ